MTAAEKLLDIEILRKLTPLETLSDAHLADLARKASIETFKSGKYLFRQGKRDPDTWYVLEGEVALLNGKTVEALIRGGSDKALSPLAPGMPRPLSARANTMVKALRIDTGLLDVILSWDQSQNSQYEVTEIQSEDDEDWMTRMLQSEMFQRLSASNIQQLIMKMEEVGFRAGEIVVSQDEEGDYYYIIKSGQAEVIRRPGNGPRLVKIAELRAGDSFGEEALLSGGKRNATIRMMTDGKLMRLSKEDFDALLREPLVEQLDYAQVQEKLKQGAMVIDVRLPGEFRQQRIDGSINLPVASIRTSTDKLNRDRDYIVVCDTGTRSASAAFLLKKLGFNTFMLADGLASVPQEAMVGTVETARDIAVGQSETAGAEIIDFKPGQKEENGGDGEREQAKELQDQLQEMRRQLAEGQQKLGQQQARLTQLGVEEEKRRASIDNLGGSLEAASQQQQEIARLKQELEEATRRMNEQAGQLSDSRTGGAQHEEKVRQLSAELKAMQERLQEADHVIEQKASEQQAVSELQKELEQAREENRKQQEQLNRQLGQLQEEINRRDRNMARLQSSMEEKQQALKAIENAKAAEIDGYEKRLRELEEKLAQQSDQTTQVSQDMRNEIAALKADRDAAVQSLQSELEQARGELEQFNEQLKKSVAERQQAEESLDALQSELHSLRETAEQQKRALEKEKAALRAELESARQSLEEKAREFEHNEQLLQEEKASLQAKLEQTREALARREQELEAREQESRKSQEQLQQELALAREALARREQALEEERQRLEREREEALRQERERLEQERERQLQTEREELEREREARLEEERERLEREREEALRQERERLEREREEQLRQERERLEREREEQLRKERERLEREREEQLRKERERLERERQQQIEEERQRLEEEKARLRRQKEEELSRLRAELESTRNTLEEKTQELDRFAEQHRQALEAKQQLEATISQSHAALQQVQKELEEKQRILEQTEHQSKEVEQQRRQEIENLNRDVETLRRRWEKALTEKERLEKAYEEQSSQLKAKGQSLQDAIDSGADSEEVKRLQEELEALKRQMSEDDKIYQKQLESLREELLANSQNQLQAEIDKARAEAEEEIRQLRKELEEANQNSAAAQAALREREEILEKQRQELAGLQAELDMAQQQGDDTEHLHQQMQTLRKAMAHEVEEHRRKLEEAMFKVKQENTELRRELEGFYRDAELASEIGGSASGFAGSSLSGFTNSQVSGYADSSMAEPLDVKDLGSGPMSTPGPESILEPPSSPAPSQSKQTVARPTEKKEQKTEAENAVDPMSEFTPPDDLPESTFDSSDIFSLADMDANLFSEQQPEEKKSSRGKLIVAAVLLLAAGGGAAWWFLGRGTPPPAPSMTRAVPTSTSTVTPPAAAPVKPAVATAAKSPAPVTARRPAPAPVKPAVPAAPVAKETVVSKPAARTSVVGVPGGLRPGRVWRDRLKNGGYGPVMVQVPGGSFMMGSPAGTTYFDERPQHAVSIRPLAVSRYEITFAEYDVFARATGRRRPSDNGWGRGRRPVVNVSWDDARAYAAWLSRQTGHKYRLPTEAEWEYFARAGTKERYWWGRHPRKGLANCFNCGSKWDARQTAPVGSFKPNPLTLYDVSGNVLEWVQDCYRKNYDAAPSDGSAVEFAGCSERVARGGSYRSTIKNMRVTRRYHFPPGVRVDNIGFRLVREK